MDCDTVTLYFREQSLNEIRSQVSFPRGKVCTLCLLCCRRVNYSTVSLKDLCVTSKVIYDSLIFLLLTSSDFP